MTGQSAEDLITRRPPTNQSHRPGEASSSIGGCKSQVAAREHTAHIRLAQFGKSLAVIGSGELCVKRDLGVQYLRDRAVFFGVLGQFEKFRLVEIRHFAAQGQS